MLGLCFYRCIRGVQAPAHPNCEYGCIFGKERGLLKVEQFHALARDCVMFAPNDRDFIVAFDRDSQSRLVRTDQKNWYRRKCYPLGIDG